MNRSLQRLEQGKLYYSISEVCRMTGLEPHVLRYWETEFPQMRPRKNSAGNRTYRTKEIQYVQFIRFLLHEEKYTIQGAKKKMADVTPEEVAGQLSLIRPYMMPEKFSDKLSDKLSGKTGGKKSRLEKLAQAKTSADENPHPENPLSSDAEASNPYRAELEKVRTELRDVLQLLGGEA